MKTKTLPIWLRAYLQIALLGEIDSSFRMIAASFSDNGDLRIRVYTDRQPTEDDQETLEILQVEIDAMRSKGEELNSSEGEFIVTTEPLRLLDRLDGVIYVRKET